MFGRRVQSIFGTSNMLSGIFYFFTTVASYTILEITD